MTTDELAFLRVIAANPGDDTPRLAYADWLDEQESSRVACSNCNGVGSCENMFHRGSPRSFCQSCEGVGSVLDKRCQNRAEFIRAQIELAQLLTPDGLVDGTDKTLYRVRELKTTTYAAPAQAKADWLRIPCAECRGIGRINYGLADGDCLMCNGTGDMGGLTWKIKGNTGTMRAAECDFRRGFPEIASCELANVLGQSGQGISNWAKAVATYHPITEFRLEDREPFHLLMQRESRNYYSWEFTQTILWQTYCHLLPIGLQPYIVAPEEEASLALYPTAEDARTALARGVANYVRAKLLQEQPI